MSATNIQIVTAIGAIATPILLAILSAVGWQLRRKVERRIELENQLRGDRIAIYNDIIEPFVILLMTEEAWSQDKKNKGRNKNKAAIQQMLSLEYRRRGFQMSLMGSDEVVRSYNALLQYFYGQSDKPENFSLPDVLLLLGEFLLEIRKSMGNEMTQLEAWDMIEWWMKDARALREQGT